MGGEKGGFTAKKDNQTRLCPLQGRRISFYLIASRIPPGQGNDSINRSYLVDLSVTRLHDHSRLDVLETQSSQRVVYQCFWIRFQFCLFVVTFLDFFGFTAFLMFIESLM